MWVFLNNAFLSIVADRNDPKHGNLLVRARIAGDLERVFPGVDVFSEIGSDYPFRAWVSRSTVANVIASQLFTVNYTNFKNSVAENDRHDAYMGVWRTMFDFQCEREAREQQPRRRTAFSRMFAGGFDFMDGNEPIEEERPARARRRRKRTRA